MRARLLAAFIDKTFRVDGLTRCVRGRAVKWRGSEEIWWGVGWRHGAKCYTRRALGVKHWAPLGHLREVSLWCYLIR